MGRLGFSDGPATQTSLYVDKSTNSPTPYVAYKDGNHGNGITVKKYNDSDDNWEIVAVASAIKYDLVHGTVEGLMPHSDITRVETAVLVKRMLDAANLITSRSL